MAKVELAVQDYRALAAFRFQLRRFLAFSSSAAEAAGVAPQQYQALLAIKGHVGEGLPSISDVAAQLLIRQHTAVELANRLETTGLVSRQAHERDGRIVLLQLTPKAEAFLADLAASHIEELEQGGTAIVELLKQIRARREHQS